MKIYHGKSAERYFIWRKFFPQNFNKSKKILRYGAAKSREIDNKIDKRQQSYQMKEIKYAQLTTLSAELNRVQGN